MWRLPHERYAGYLLAEYGPSRVARYLENNRLPIPEGAYRTYLIRKYPLRRDVPDKYDADHDLYMLLTGHPDAVAALELLTSRARVYVEQCLLSGMDVATVGSAVEQKANVSIREEVIALYELYFWDSALLTHDEWIDYLSSYEVASAGYEAALGGRESLAHYLDLPFEVKAKDAFRDLFNFAYANIMRYRKRLDLTPKEVRAIESWTKIMIQAEAARTAEESVLHRVMRALEKFVLKGREEGFRELDELRKEHQ